MKLSERRKGFESPNDDESHYHLYVNGYWCYGDNDGSYVRSEWMGAKNALLVLGIKYSSKIYTNIEIRGKNYTIYAIRTQEQ